MTHLVRSLSFSKGSMNEYVFHFQNHYCYSPLLVEMGIEHYWKCFCYIHGPQVSGRRAEGADVGATLASCTRRAIKLHAGAAIDVVLSGDMGAKDGSIPWLIFDWASAFGGRERPTSGFILTRSNPGSGTRLPKIVDLG